MTSNLGLTLHFRAESISRSSRIAMGNKVRISMYGITIHADRHIAMQINICIYLHCWFY